MSDPGVVEETWKSIVARTWFSGFACDPLGKVDFTVAPKKHKDNEPEKEFFLWAESKMGALKKREFLEAFVQLVWTIGKARASGKYRNFWKKISPHYLGVFDEQKIAFVPYSIIKRTGVFSLNDFDWATIKPREHEPQDAFRLTYDVVADVFDKEKTLFYFNKKTSSDMLPAFINKNFRVGLVKKEKIQIDPENVCDVFLEWEEEVAPQIDVDWEDLKGNKDEELTEEEEEKEEKKEGFLLDTDFFLADLFSKDNHTSAVIKINDSKDLNKDVRVLLEGTYYRSPLRAQLKNLGDLWRLFQFKDGGQAHKNFWQNYERPPEEKFRNEIIRDRHKLVPKDVRERKGAYFTPPELAKKSQEYLTAVLGKNWQNEYYIWDCCAGTGNLLEGLGGDNYNVYASTLDEGDVAAMKIRIAAGKLNLLSRHVFQFDFLKDEFTKLPQALQDIINDSDKRKKLVIYINPPYAEATNASTVSGTGESKKGVAKFMKMNKRYKNEIGRAANELFALFFIRIYKEIPGCILAEFSKLKHVLSPNFKKFREAFRAKLEKLFIVPSNMFYNVNKDFPVGFFVWDTAKEEAFERITADVYNKKGKFIGTRQLLCPREYMNEWAKKYNHAKDSDPKIKTIGTLFYRGNDFQNQRYIYIGNGSSDAHDSEFYIDRSNLSVACIYFTMRWCMARTWKNDRDQFSAPNDNKWADDLSFQADCLTYTLFHSQNRIRKDSEGKNDWIPFTRKEVIPQDEFKSEFMMEFILGKLEELKEEETSGEPSRLKLDPTLPKKSKKLKKPLKPKENFYYGTKKITFSPEALAVFDAGRELWKYYHERKDSDPNATYYDIRLYFKGINKETGEMNLQSDDDGFTSRYNRLDECLKKLAENNIVPKAKKYGFLPIESA